MRKVFLLAAALTVTGFVAAFACELDSEASKPVFAIRLPDGCGGSDCLVNPAQDPFIPVDQSAAYFEPSTYSGSNGLSDWLIALAHTQSQYKPEPDVGFPSSPMDAYAQDR